MAEQLFTTKSEETSGGQETRAQLFIVRREEQGKKRIGETEIGRKRRERRNGGHYSAEERDRTFSSWRESWPRMLSTLRRGNNAGPQLYCHLAHPGHGLTPPVRHWRAAGWSLPSTRCRGVCRMVSTARVLARMPPSPPPSPSATTYVCRPGKRPKASSFRGRTLPRAVRTAVLIGIIIFLG